MTRLLWSVLFLCFFAGFAFGHGENAWVAKYLNAKGINCCGPMDTTFIDGDTARSARVGTVITADFPNGRASVTVQIIRQTEDTQGRAVLTRYGCLFTSALF